MLVDKHRPLTLDDVFGQDDIVKKVKRLSKMTTKPPNMLFLGPAGVGKTSTAIAYARERYGDEWRQHYIEMNASDERGIGVVRDKIKKLSGLAGERIIFLSEADNITEDAQNALRRVMEKSRTAIFILDGNNERQIIDAIKSRNAVFYFKKIDSKDIVKTLASILKKEEITYGVEHKEVLESIVENANGDLRKAINDLETCVDFENKIIIPDVIRPTETSGKSILEALKVGNFKNAKTSLENAFITAGWNGQKIVDDMFAHVEIFDDPNVQLRIYDRLGVLNRDLPIVANQLVALVSFCAYVMLAQAVAKKIKI